MKENIFKDEDLSGIMDISPPKKDIFKGEDVSWLIPQRKERIPRGIFQPLISKEKGEEIKKKLRPLAEKITPALKTIAKVPVLPYEKLAKTPVVKWHYEGLRQWTAGYWEQLKATAKDPNVKQEVTKEKFKEFQRLERQLSEEKRNPIDTIQYFGWVGFLANIGMTGIQLLQRVPELGKMLLARVIPRKILAKMTWEVLNPAEKLNVLKKYRPDLFRPQPALPPPKPSIVTPTIAKPLPTAVTPSRYLGRKAPAFIQKVIRQVGDPNIRYEGIQKIKGQEPLILLFDKTTGDDIAIPKSKFTIESIQQKLIRKRERLVKPEVAPPTLLTQKDIDATIIELGKYINLPLHLEIRGFITEDIKYFGAEANIFRVTSDMGKDAVIHEAIHTAIHTHPEILNNFIEKNKSIIEKSDYYRKFPAEAMADRIVFEMMGKFSPDEPAENIEILKQVTYKRPAVTPSIAPPVPEEVKPGIPRGWKIIQDTQWLKKYKTYEGTLEISISQTLPKDGLRKFTFKIRKIGKKIEIRARNLEEAIEKYRLETGAVAVYKRAELRLLEKYEINRVLTDLEMTAMKIPPTDADIKSSLETVVGTLSKEEISQAIKDVKLYTGKPTEQSTETMLDGAARADENAFSGDWQRWRELGRQWGQLTNEEKAEFWEIADKISDRISEGVIPPDEMLGFPLGDLKEDWKLGGMRGFLSTAGGILPYGLDIHAWFPKHAIRSARAVKTMMSKQEMMHKMGEWVIRKINKAGKPLGITNEDYAEAFIPATQRALLKDYSLEQQKKFKAIFEITDKFFEEQLATLKEKGILRMGFVERVVKEARENIRLYRVAQSKAISSGEKAELKLQIKQEQEVLEFIKKMDVKYVHLPVKLLLEQLWEKPALRKYLKLSRFFRRRETLDVASWLKELEGQRYPEAVRNTKAIRKEIKDGKAMLVKGSIDTDTELVVTRPVLDRKMLDIRRVIAAYSSKLGRLYGLADVVNAFQHDGLIRDLPTTGIIPDGWADLPTRIFPEFRGKIAKGVVADWLKEYLEDTFRRGVGLSRFFAYFKLMQFTRLLFMPYYDVQQASIHWGLRWALMKPHKVPAVIVRAIKSFVKKDEHFWNFWNYGGTSKPFAAPFKSYMNEVEVLLQETGMKKLMKFISYHWKTPVDFLYIPIWNINWGGDEFVRLISYHAMLEEGHIPEEAAQIAATAHSDYARMPVKTRRVLNKILFVPVFPVTMAMWEYEMLKAAVLESMRMGAMGLGKVFPPMKRLEAKLTPTADEVFRRRKSMAKGLLGFVMMVALREGIQKALGFKTKVPGLSSTRIVDDPDNPGQQKELVKYIPTPDNVLLRHIFRWSGLPSEPDKLDLFATKLGGILHPLLAFPIECLRNRKRDYTLITEISLIWGGPKGWAKMGLDYMAYAGERLVPILKSVPGLSLEYKEERNKAIREWRKSKGPYWIKRIMEPFIFLYMRNTRDRRGISQAKEFLRIIRQEAREAERIKGRPLTERELGSYDDRIRKMEEVLMNLKEYKTKREEPWEHIEENLEGIVE